MARELLKKANRDLLDAIEKPPDAGNETRLDRFAAELWYLSTDRDQPPDHGRLERIDQKLAVIEETTHPNIATCIKRARRHINEYRKSVVLSH